MSYMTLTELKNRKLESGFTIVELLIVIVVIAILAALVLTAYNGVQARARDSSRQSDVRSIATAVEAIASENAGVYPANSAAITSYTTVKLDSTIAGKMQDGSATDPSATNDKYEYLRCNQTAPSSVTGIGAQIKWWKEESSSLQTRNLGTTSGAGLTITCS